jgi:hypothetical protein
LFPNFNNKYNDMNTKESFKKVKELIAEGNVRHISITDKDGKDIMSFPLTVGVVAAVLAPVLAAVGALAALIGDCSITVERDTPTTMEHED